MLRRAALTILFLALFSSLNANALDEIQGVTAVWNDFVTALRRGDYLNAHGLFSAQSRDAMPYAEFADEYGPLSAARELILAKPDSLATRIDGDWGEITYGGANPGTGRKFSVGVSFVRNQNGWGLVAARNEAPERIEAGARALLRLLRDNRRHGAPRDLVAALTRAQGENPVLQFYRLETDGARFTAFPRENTLRTFFVDEWGAVRSVEQTPQILSRQTLVQTPQESAIAAPVSSQTQAQQNRQSRDPNAMPELSDPALASPAPQLSDWAEPPMIPVGRPNVVLPDTIR